MPSEMPAALSLLYMYKKGNSLHMTDAIGSVLVTHTLLQHSINIQYNIKIFAK